MNGQMRAVQFIADNPEKKNRMNGIIWRPVTRDDMHCTFFPN